MFYLRLFGSGLDNSRSDPRDKVWAEYQCSLCGMKSEIDVTSIRHNFDFEKERQCPHCRMIDSADKEKNLKAKLEKLTIDKSRIEVQIEQLIREIDEMKNLEFDNKGLNK
jgi:glutaredoxin